MSIHESKRSLPAGMRSTPDDSPHGSPHKMQNHPSRWQTSDSRCGSGGNVIKTRYSSKIREINRRLANPDKGFFLGDGLKKSHPHVRAPIGWRRGGNGGGRGSSLRSLASFLTPPALFVSGFIPRPHHTPFRLKPDEPLDGLCAEKDRYGPSEPAGVLDVGHHVCSGKEFFVWSLDSVGMVMARWGLQLGAFCVWYLWHCERFRCLKRVLYFPSCVCSG
ncbi:hypothetical protein BDM02DRAFT_391013 [Thelephora ganbajun]|uniref:Uncharacterized protein n=1 Tax=Thelephora ganbajun TaxID=370292 RepID=A0ACB6Z8F3_THEGA|nr:hypothetical protein BDM02DRAFT_391013 [Thelephora ganbajun]